MSAIRCTKVNPPAKLSREQTIAETICELRRDASPNSTPEWFAQEIETELLAWEADNSAPIYRIELDAETFKALVAEIGSGGRALDPEEPRGWVVRNAIMRAAWNCFGGPNDGEGLAVVPMIEEAVLEGPPELRHKLTGPYIRLANQQPPLALQVSKAADGRLVCTGLLIGWQLDRHPLADPIADRVGITARQLRGIHLPEILAQAVRSQPDMLPATAPTVRPPHPGNVGYPDEYYENIARQYRDALVVEPRSPMKRLAKQLNVAPATAYRLRDEAIRRGFLEPRPSGEGEQEGDRCSPDRPCDSVDDSHIALFGESYERFIDIGKEMPEDTVVSETTRPVVDQKRLFATTDAMVWAEEWCKIAREIEDADDGRKVIDERWMVCWFANAMVTAEMASSRILNRCCPGNTVTAEELADWWQMTSGDLYNNNEKMKKLLARFFPEHIARPTDPEPAPVERCGKHIGVDLYCVRPKGHGPVAGEGFGCSSVWRPEDGPEPNQPVVYGGDGTVKR